MRTTRRMHLTLAIAAALFVPVLAVGAIWQPSALANSASGICDRTGEVREAILGRLADLGACPSNTVGELLWV